MRSSSDVQLKSYILQVKSYYKKKVENRHYFIIKMPIFLVNQLIQLFVRLNLKKTITSEALTHMVSQK